MPKEFREIEKADDDDTKFTEASCAFHFWSSIEDWLIRTWVNSMITTESLQKHHVSLHFDGIRISDDLISVGNFTGFEPEEGCPMDQFIATSETVIQKKTGFRVKIKIKPHKDLIGMLTTTDEKVVPTPDPCPEELLQDGNCIMLAIGRCVNNIKQVIADLGVMDTGMSQGDKDEQTARTYKQCADATKVTLRPTNTLQNVAMSKWLILSLIHI